MGVVERPPRYSAQHGTFDPGCFDSPGAGEIACDGMGRVTLAFEQLNLRWNPFSEPELEDIPRLAVVDVEPLVERLRRPGFAVQYLGEAGRGKSTHLMALHQHFPDMPYLRFPEGMKKPPPIPDAPILFLDETQRLPARLRRQVFARKVSYAIGTHEDHSAELRRAGIDTVSIRIEGLTPERLGQIVERRIEWARRGPGPLPSVSPGMLAQLIADHGDDLAAILAHLYDEFQRREEGEDGRDPSPV